MCSILGAENRFIRPVHVHLKTDKVDFKKAFFSKFFLSTHQVGMKNVVECYKDFFGYFNALKTHCEVLLHKENKVREVLIIGIRLPLSFGRKLCQGDSFLANQGLIP